MAGDALDRLVVCLAADGIEDDVDARPADRGFDALVDRCLPVVDDVVGPERTAEVDLLGGS